MIKFITIAVLFLHVIPGIHVASDALTNSPCTMRCLYNQRFRLKHVPTGKYIVYRTDGLEDYVRMVTKDDMWSHESSVFCRSLVDPTEVGSHLAKVHIIAVDAKICSSGSAVNGKLYRADNDQVALRADNLDDLGNFYFDYDNREYDTKLETLVARYIIQGPGNQAALEVNNYGKLIVQDRWTALTHIATSLPEVGDLFAMEIES